MHFLAILKDNRQKLAGLSRMSSSPLRLARVCQRKESAEGTWK